MSTSDLGAIFALGAFHGINPAMGWLFAVALALQERSRLTLLRSLPPIAAGHAASVAVVLVLVEGARSVVSAGEIRVAGAAALAGFGIWKLLSARHPRWVGFRVRGRELALWSFLMSTAHGAGLMLLPFVIGVQASGGAEQLVVSGLHGAAVAVLVHTAGMILVAGAVAFAVYEVVGVGILRTAWVNVDRLWAMALLVGAGATLFA